MFSDVFTFESISTDEMFIVKLTIQHSICGHIIYGTGLQRLDSVSLTSW
jgi:hypothetical protein